MIRFGARTAIALALIGVSGGAFAADLAVDRYLRNPSLGTDGSGGNYYSTSSGQIPTYQPPVPPSRNYRSAVPATPTPVSPPAAVPSAPAAAAVSAEAGAPVADSSSFAMAMFWVVLACLVIAFYLTAKRLVAAGRFYASAANDALTPFRSVKPSDESDRHNRAVTVPRSSVPAPKQAFPSQDGWASRAGTVRNPVSGFFFGVGARANARAHDEEQKRMKSARGVIKEYAGMYRDLLEGEEAATAHAVRRDLGAAHYEHERATQTEAFDEAAHRRELAGKRRKKELTEADTRRIEAEHEQEAVERFKEPKFAAGLARFEAKSKEHLVGAATADAAIAETKEAAQPPENGNESAEVMQLYRLLQSAMAAIEEGERLGRDTQALRERAELYKKLLNLA